MANCLLSGGVLRSPGPIYYWLASGTRPELCNAQAQKFCGLMGGGGAGKGFSGSGRGQGPQASSDWKSWFYPRPLRIGGASERACAEFRALTTTKGPALSG